MLSSADRFSRVEIGFLLRSIRYMFVSPDRPVTVLMLLSDMVR